MAAPDSITTLDISGKYLMNKTLSDDTDEILRLQGMGWLSRKAVKMATIYVNIKHYKDDDGVEHIDIEQHLTAGLGNTTELRTLDWTEREHEDHIFGAVVGKSRRAKLEEIQNEFLKTGFLDETKEHGGINSWVQSDTPKSGKTWIAEQVWGFEDVNGEKRYTRHVYFIGPDTEQINARMVFDYRGPL